jgi:hypothetical protein
MDLSLYCVWRCSVQGVSGYLTYLLHRAAGVEATSVSLRYNKISVSLFAYCCRQIRRTTIILLVVLCLFLGLFILVYLTTLPTVHVTSRELQTRRIKRP